MLHGIHSERLLKKLGKLVFSKTTLTSHGSINDITITFQSSKINTIVCVHNKIL